jgi:predicted nucleic acid-binding protein
MLGERPSYWPSLRERVEQGRTGGAQVHDARIAALCLEHGARELLTVDRDFSRFRNLAARNPLGA